MNAYLAEMSMKSEATESEFLSLDTVAKAFSVMQTPSVRPKDGVHFKSILEREGVGIKKTSSVQTLSPFDSFRKDGPSKTSVPEKASDHLLMTPKDSLSYNGLTNIVQRQNDITSILARQQQLSYLPPREIPLFSGDVLSYRPFIRAFEYSIELKTDSSADRLYFVAEMPKNVHFFP